jgi:GH15 family glucan-1,4-alpha-glucosidase
MQDPSGGIIAAPEFHYELSHCGGYGYCWGRDAGFITLAMDICGMHEESANFYRYMKLCQSADGSFLHRHDMQGNLGSSWGFLQPDETGSVIFGLWKHLELSGNQGLMTELKSMITNACDWLAHVRNKDNPELPIAGFDLWEERVGVHIYAIAAMGAGLDAGIRIAQAMDWEISADWTQRLAEYRTLINSSLFIRNMSQATGEKQSDLVFARTLHRQISNEHGSNLRAKGYDVKTRSNENGRIESTLSEDFVLDISQLGVQYPYDILDLDKYGNEFDQLIELIGGRLWRPGVGGIGRYEADHYRDGNPWILSTLWLALSAAQRGKTEIAEKAWRWVLQFATAEGLLPEQIDPVTGQAAWVMPLTWSHAMFALSIHQLPEEITK